MLAEIKKLLPSEKYIYFADSEHCPYGEKSLPELQKIVSDATEYLLARGAEVIVVACNTATTQTINYLRQKYPSVPFIGTEPAIKKACEETPSAATGKTKIVLLATEGTTHSTRTHELVQNNLRPDQEILTVSCPGLAKAIETNDSPKITEILQQTARTVAEKWPCTETDGVVLGCTHYPLIRDQIQALFPNAKLFDGGEGVAREVKRVVLSRRLL